MPSDVDTIIEETFNSSPSHLEGSHKDSEANLLEGMKALKEVHGVGDSTSTSSNRLILVCYHLPVEVRKTGNPDKPFDIEWAESLIAKTEGSISESRQTLWFGTLSIRGEKPTQSEINYLVGELQKMNCYPIFLDEDVKRLAYHGYCKQVMWPIFHNVDQLDQIHAAWNVAHMPSSRRSSSNSAGKAVK